MKDDDDDDTGLSNRNPLDRIMGSGASDIQQGEGEKRTGKRKRGALGLLRPKFYLHFPAQASFPLRQGVLMS